MPSSITDGALIIALSIRRRRRLNDLVANHDLSALHYPEFRKLRSIASYTSVITARLRSRFDDLMRIPEFAAIAAAMPAPDTKGTRRQRRKSRDLHRVRTVRAFMQRDGGLEQMLVICGWNRPWWCRAEGINGARRAA